jgi:TonB family protein
MKPSRSLAIMVATIGVVISCCAAPPREIGPLEALSPPRGGCPNRGAAGCNVAIVHKSVPVLVSMGAPTYSQAAREASAQGTVWCHVYVDTTGLVTGAHVLQGVDPLLDDAALRASESGLFQPARREDGSKVALWVIVPITFKVS